MKAHVTIDPSSPLTLPLSGHLDSLPFPAIEKEKKSFEQAVKECNGIPLDEFIDKLRRHINEQYDKLENA
jgi:hypothetical protein